MENSIPSHSSNSVYPGEYVPFMKKEQFMEELKHPQQSDVLLPEFIVTELEDLIKIEIEIHGVNREDFLVLAEENTVSVFLVH